jgi:hypothetical protein
MRRTAELYDSAIAIAPGVVVILGGVVLIQRYTSAIEGGLRLMRYAKQLRRSRSRA